MPKTDLRAVVYTNFLKGNVRGSFREGKCTRSDLRGSEFQKNFLGGMPPDPPSMTCPMIMNPGQNIPTHPYKNICFSEKVSHPQQKILYETLLILTSSPL